MERGQVIPTTYIAKCFCFAVLLLSSLVTNRMGFAQSTFNTENLDSLSMATDIKRLEYDTADVIIHFVGNPGDRKGQDYRYGHYLPAVSAYLVIEDSVRLLKVLSFELVELDSSEREIRAFRNEGMLLSNVIKDRLVDLETGDEKNFFLKNVFVADDNQVIKFVGLRPFLREF